MSWEDRVREAAFTPPSGTRLRFQFEDVSREIEKRTTAFEFPGVDGAFVQENGYGSRKYPLRCYFAGITHDLDATAFEVALLEPGIGRLEHPLYGAFDAIQFGTITRRDDLKSAANQTVIEVVFWTTVGALYPSAEADPRNELLASLDVLDLTSSTEYAALADLSTSAARVATKSSTRSLLRMASDALGEVAGAVSAVNRDFRDTQDAINYGLDVLVGQPLQLALQVANLVKAPALARVGIDLRLEGYRRLAERIFGAPFVSSVGAELAGTRLRLSNSFHTNNLFAMAAVAGSVRAVAEHTFVAKPDALAAADEVLALFDRLVAWRDAGFGSIGQVDPGASYQALQQAVALVAGYLLQVSFTLATERRVVLDRARTIIDLAAELYGSVDDRLDVLITTNGLTGQEILELPSGRVIAYYI